MTLVHIQPPIQ